MRPTAHKLSGRSAITERRSWNPDKQYQHQYELRQKRALGETQQKQRKAQAARDEKQARLEAHLQRRSAAYRETVGSSPPMTAYKSGRWST